MHEISLEGTIRDYLTGEEIPNTTYEEVRQALSRLMVEERGYPAERLRTKVGVRFPVEGEEYCRTVDLAAYDEAGLPLLAVIFCSGEPGSYDRETVAAARLFPGGPCPLAVATDTKTAVLLEARSGETLRMGMQALPHYDELVELARDRRFDPFDGVRLERERRILYAYSEMLSSCCEGTVCALPGRHGE